MAETFQILLSLKLSQLSFTGFLSQGRSLFQFKLVLDITLHFVKGLNVSRSVFNNTGRNQCVVSNFHGLCISLFLEAVRREQVFNDTLRDVLSIRRCLRKTGLSQTVKRMKCQTVFFNCRV